MRILRENESKSKVIKCLREGYHGRMNAALKRKLDEEANEVRGIWWENECSP